MTLATEPTQTSATIHRDDEEPADRAVRRLPVGAEVLPGGRAHFRVWAPKCQCIEVVIPATKDDTTETCTELRPEENGYHSGIVERVVPSMLYGLRCNGGERVWEILWSTNRVEYGGVGTPPIQIETGWQIAGESAVVLRAVPPSADGPTT